MCFVLSLCSFFISFCVSFFRRLFVCPLFYLLFACLFLLFSSSSLESVDDSVDELLFLLFRAFSGATGRFISFFISAWTAIAFLQVRNWMCVFGVIISLLPSICSCFSVLFFRLFLMSLSSFLSLSLSVLILSLLSPFSFHFLPAAPFSTGLVGPRACFGAPRLQTTVSPLLREVLPASFLFRCVLLSLRSPGPGDLFRCT